MNTLEKLNNVLGYLTAMSFYMPEVADVLEKPLNDLSEAIGEIETLTTNIKTE